MLISCSFNSFRIFGYYICARLQIIWRPNLWLVLISFNWFLPLLSSASSNPTLLLCRWPQPPNIALHPSSPRHHSHPRQSASESFFFTYETFYNTSSCFHFMHGYHPPGLCPLHLMTSPTPSPFHFQMRTLILFPFKLYYVCEMNVAHCNWHQKQLMVKHSDRFSGRIQQCYFVFVALTIEAD